MIDKHIGLVSGPISFLQSNRYSSVYIFASQFCYQKADTSRTAHTMKRQIVVIYRNSSLIYHGPGTKPTAYNHPYPRNCSKREGKGWGRFGVVFKLFIQDSIDEQTRCPMSVIVDGANTAYPRGGRYTRCAKVGGRMAMVKERHEQLK